MLDGDDQSRWGVGDKGLPLCVSQESQTSHHVDVHCFLIMGQETRAVVTVTAVGGGEASRRSQVHQSPCCPSDGTMLPWENVVAT